MWMGETEQSQKADSATVNFECFSTVRRQMPEECWEEIDRYSSPEMAVELRRVTIDLQNPDRDMQRVHPPLLREKRFYV